MDDEVERLSTEILEEGSLRRNKSVHYRLCRKVIYMYIHVTPAHISNG